MRIQIKQLGSVQEQRSFGMLEAGEGVVYETHQAHVHVLLGPLLPELQGCGKKCKNKSKQQLKD